jgi:RNA polymerase sigma-70 factor (ECF subfamily)
MHDEFETMVLTSRPKLMRQAINLSHSTPVAEDLVQDTLVAALSKRHQFQEGTHLRAWLAVILRNNYFTYIRLRRREVEDPDDALALRLTTAPHQEMSVAHQEILRGIDALPPSHRQAVTLIHLDEMSYEDASAATGIPIGTLRSRVFRGRHALTG